ncbi:MAG: hypothetical protein GEU28_04885 [Dehalococcoidia bacterium]|nr:hypothetical protein [Dehalococcoidia bacterium]
MPKFSKLTDQEIERVKAHGAISAEDDRYLAFLRKCKPGDWGALMLEEGESQRSVKRRMTKAGRVTGLVVNWAKPSNNGRLIFHLQAMTNGASPSNGRSHG